MKRPAWLNHPLHELTPEQWEALCDGCGRCCLHKLEDEDTGEVVYTRVACILLDTATAQCQDYPHRQSRVPGCVQITPDNVHSLYWLPRTCAYRLRAEGRQLYDWHPLLSGSQGTVMQAGIGVMGRVISEDKVDEDAYEDHVVRWVKS